MFSKMERRETVSRIALHNEFATDQTNMADEDIALLTESSFEIFCQAKVIFLKRLWSACYGPYHTAHMISPYKEEFSGYNLFSEG